MRLIAIIASGLPLGRLKNSMVRGPVRSTMGTSRLRARSPEWVVIRRFIIPTFAIRVSM